MIKKLIFFLFATFSFVNIDAQKFHYGFGLGFDVSNTNSTNSKSSAFVDKFSKPKLGFNLNAFISYKDSAFIGFTLEPGFIQKGWRDSYLKDKFNVNFNYLQLPLTADFYLNNKFSISLGPEIAYLVQAKSGDFDLKDFGYNKFEISALVGVNYAIAEKIKLGIRYNHGFSPISEDIYTDASGQIIFKSKNYNQYFQLNVKYVLK